jgi:peptidoglycan/LPS O-acetylase OafA/YrhL
VSGVLDRQGDDFWFRFVQATIGQSIDVLFVISGFVVFLPTVARRGDFGRVGAYAIRRAARIVPGYWLILAIVLGLLLAVPHHPPISFPRLGSIAAHFLFVHTPVAAVHPLPIGFGVDGAVWTLSVEATFYFVLPFVAAWYFRRPLVGLAVAALLTAAWHEALIHYQDLTSAAGFHPSVQVALRHALGGMSQFPYFIFSFAAGMTGAWAYVHLSRRDDAHRLARRMPAVQIAALAVLAVTGWQIGRHTIPSIVAAEFGRRSPWVAIGYSGALATLMVATALGPRVLQAPFANPLARWLGDIGYGVFVVHLVVVVYVVQPLARHWPAVFRSDGSLRAFAVIAAVVVPLSLVYGYLSARFVELPIRRWAHRFGARGQAQARAAAGAQAS